MNLHAAVTSRTGNRLLALWTEDGRERDIDLGIIVIRVLVKMYKSPRCPSV